MSHTPDAGPTTAPAESALLLWSDLATRWPALPGRERRAILTSVAECLRDAWQRGVRLDRLPLNYIALRENPSGWTASLPSRLVERDEEPLPVAAIQRALASWTLDAAAALRPSEAARFLRTFLAREAVSPRARATLARQLALDARRHAAARTASIYQHVLVANAGPGAWQPDPTIRPAGLLDAIRAAETDPQATPLKVDAASAVLRTTLLGHDVLLKKFVVTRPLARLRYLVRASKGRRGWAAGQTLHALGIPTARPLGFAEQRDRGSTTSYAIAAFVPGSESAYRWLRRTYRTMDAAARDQVLRTIASMLLALYDHAIYHADTKLQNLLAVDADDPAKRRLLWIDLESVVAGHIPTRRQVLRNIIQLNGSARSWLPEADRMAFLRHLAPRFPWLLEPGTIAAIRRTTTRRLRAELEGRTPPDGRRAATR